MSPQTKLARWLRDRCDFIERAPRKINRVILPPAVRSTRAAVEAAISHSKRTNRKVVLQLDPLTVVFIDRDEVEVLAGGEPQKELL